MISIVLNKTKKTNYCELILNKRITNTITVQEQIQ